MPIGPQLPATAEKRKRSSDDDSDSSDDSFGPVLPTNNDDASSLKKARVVGPSLPPSHSVQTGEQETKGDTKDEESSDDDDDFGPSLPPPPESKPDPVETVRRQADTVKGPSAAPKVQRDEWMTLAPTSGDWSQRVDPTKLKNRKFNTGKSSTASKSRGPDIWNETPEQKQARLKREVLGLQSDGSGPSATTAVTTKDDETARRMKEYNSQRGPSLYEAHQKGKAIEEDDPSARAFDREKDIAGGLQINATKRREMMKKSGDFNSRFSSAKYL